MAVFRVFECQACGCSEAFDKYGDRLCWCDSCKAMGCTLVEVRSGIASEGSYFCRQCKQVRIEASEPRSDDEEHVCRKCALKNLDSCPRCENRLQAFESEIAFQIGAHYCTACSSTAVDMRKGMCPDYIDELANPDVLEGYRCEARHAASLEDLAAAGIGSRGTEDEARDAVSKILRLQAADSETLPHSQVDGLVWAAVLRHAVYYLRASLQPEIWLGLRLTCRGLSGCVASLLHQQALACKASMPTAPLSKATRQRLATLAGKGWAPSNPLSGVSSTIESEPAEFSASQKPRRLDLATGSFTLHAHQVVVDSHKYCFFGGEQLMVLAWFSYFDGTFWRQCRIFEDWEDDNSGYGEEETLFISAGLLGCPPSDHFRFNWNWQWDKAHMARAATTLRRENSRPRLNLEGVPREKWECMHQLQQSLGIRHQWKSEERFWGFFTTAWAGLPLTERAHEFGLCKGSFDGHTFATKLTCECHGQYRDCPHHGIHDRITSYKLQSRNWAVQHVQDLQLPAPPE